MLPASNFTFLTVHDPQLVQLGGLAERYFRDDPGTTIFKLRQFAELLSKSIAARHALYLGERETFEDTLRRLAFERIIPKEAADIFHALRKAGNRAAHEQPHSLRADDWPGHAVVPGY
jgi:type I restriction enzyme R subunit